ncbi:hypothetical protein Dimus_034527 [Dionaea muscipula]
MPRKPRRHSFSLALPFAFSPFARSLVQVANAFMMKHPVYDRKLCELSFSESKATRPVGQSPKGTEEIVQADFAFFDPKPDDFHGAKILLQTYLDDRQWDLSGFVDLILAQTTVGSVVKIEDDEDDGAFALVTVLNLGRYKGHKCILQLKDYLLEVCKENILARNLRILLEDQAENVGLLISQRVTNLPLQLLPHLYRGLFDEISWATEDEPTEELRRSFQFRCYLLISRIYKKNGANSKGAANSNEEVVIYIKPEDELFHQLCSWSFIFPLQTRQVAAQELRNYRMMGLVMAIDADKAPIFRRLLESLIDDS